MRPCLALTFVAALTAPTFAQDAVPPEEPAVEPTPEPVLDATADPAATEPTAAPTSEPKELGTDDDARSADKGTFGIGLILGEPTGISAKLYLDDDQALQAAVGFALIGGGVHVHVDYVFHPYILQSRDSFVLPVYIGPGVRVIDYANGRDESYLAFGLRAVGGLLFDFREIPLDAFVEIAGVFEFGLGDDGGFGLALNAAAGARYYF
jgi:hypothetical protein